VLPAGRAVMVQPYLRAVEADGETSLIYLGGRFSHAVRKNPLLAFGGPGDLTLEAWTGALSAVEPTSAQLELAEQALAHAPGGDQLAYARVDLVRGNEGADLLLELELVEPALFFSAHPAGVGRLADVLFERAGAG
jgi:hypothetical protein